MKHFVLGFAAHEAEQEFCVASLDFTDPAKLRLAIQFLASQRTGALLSLLIELRQLFPVARIGNQVYPVSDDELPR